MAKRHLEPRVGRQGKTARRLQRVPRPQYALDSRVQRSFRDGDRGLDGFQKASRCGKGW
ncbi:hypothetical protein PC116_g5647 [Phytophthora cactorum]|uniref:Uncharacterized protein n=1 Tax=Phytophthora cactorum TaxID=29920 RepID=A0A8T1D6P6_9STRA|nr:hypothetical protein PC114_g12675 [Phytophthora cactorum]KAG2936114.1 hypothetical protein PC117_g12212 [Phytophthora cactorum]KAG3013848.1 hypothetical protein PC119_g12352 [Phytophthora cactorum]KAG3016804.1 hypothetical protein PC120_g11416 [Phytophthora cactorum]KAG3161935.1 hypothetical protein C6341_g13426 [Phytophthora cactorum]